MELFKLETGIDVLHVPSMGLGGAMSDIIAGHVQVVISALQSAAPHVHSGKLRMLAVMSLPRAVGRSVYLEQSARMQMQALVLSKTITYLDEAEVRASMPVQNYNRAWPLWRDKALARAREDKKK